MHPAGTAGAGDAPCTHCSSSGCQLGSHLQARRGKCFCTGSWRQELSAARLCAGAGADVQHAPSATSPLRIWGILSPSYFSPWSGTSLCAIFVQTPTHGPWGWAQGKEARYTSATALTNCKAALFSPETDTSPQGSWRARARHPPLLQTREGTSAIITQIDALWCCLPVALIQSHGSTN